MKKLFACAIMLLLLGLFAACGGGADQADMSGVPAITPEPSDAPPPGMQVGYILMNAGWLSVYDPATDVIEFKKYLDLGETVYFDPNDKLTKTEKKSTRATEFTKIIRKKNNSDVGYVRSYWLGTEGALSVTIMDKVAKYSSMSLTDLTKTTLPQLTFGVSSPVPGDDKWTKFTYFDNTAWAQVSVYVRPESVSNKEDDVLVAQLILAARADKDTTRKTTFLQSAQASFPNSQLQVLVSQDLDAILLAGMPTLLPFSGTLTVTTDQCYIYSAIPSGDQAPSPMMSLPKDSQVIADQKADATSKLNGKDGQWIHIVQPQAGYVFSTDFTQAAEAVPANGEAAPASDQSMSGTDNATN